MFNFYKPNHSYFQYSLHHTFYFHHLHYTDQVRAHDALQDARSVRSLFFADNLAGAFFRYELNRAMTQGKTVAEERAMEGIASNGNGSGNSRSHEIKVGSGPNDNASKQPLIDFIVD